MSATMTVAGAKELTNQFLAKKAQLDGLLAKGNEFTQADLEASKAIKVDLDNIKGRIQVFSDADALRADSAGYDGYLNDPVRTLPFAVGGKSDDVTGLIGTQDAGSSTVEYKNGKREVVFEDGPGIFGAKQWKAINSTEYHQAFRSYLKTGLHKMRAVELKVLEEGIDDQGGYTVPIDQIARLVQRLPTPTRIAGMVNNLNTSREFVEMMKLNYAADNIYTTGFRVTKTGENPSSVTQARMTDTNLFGTIKIPVHTYMITGLLTQNQVEDSALNILQFVSDKFFQTIEILKDDKTLNGTGKMESTGMLANPGGTDQPTVITSGDAANLTADGLVNLALDVPEQYEDGCKYVFNKTSTFKQIRTLKDLNDRYLFGQGVQDSGLATPTRPTDLLGYPFVYSGLMPNVAANAYPVIFGDLMGYQLVNRVGFSVQVLRELYAELNQVAVVGRVRFGGQTIEPWRLRIQQVHV